MVERQSQSAGQQAVLTFLALSAIPNMAAKPDGTKKSQKVFRELTQRLAGDD